MSFRIDQAHPWARGDVIRIRTITDIAEDTEPFGTPTWKVERCYWENSLAFVDVKCVQGGMIRRGVDAARCRLISAVDQLGDVARD